MAKEKSKINKFFKRSSKYLFNKKPKFFNPNFTFLKENAVLNPYKNILTKQKLGKGKHKRKKKWIRIRPFFRRVEFFMRKKRHRRRFFRYSGFFTFRRKRTYRPYKKRKLVKRRRLGGFLNKRRNSLSDRKPITRIKHRYRFKKRPGLTSSINIFKKLSFASYEKKKKWKKKLKKQIKRLERIQRIGRRYILPQIIKFIKTVITISYSKKRSSFTRFFPFNLAHNSFFYKKLDFLKTNSFNIIKTTTQNSQVHSTKILFRQFNLFFKFYKKIYFSLLVKKISKAYQKIKGYISKK